MTEGTLTAWTAREGQAVSKGEPILEVETDKIVNTVEAPAAGILRRITAEAGEIRPVGALIAVLADESVSEADVAEFVDAFQGASVSFEPESQEPAEVANDPEAGEPRVSPIARRLADKLGLDVSQIRGTGRNGRVSKEDVEAHAATSGGRVQLESADTHRDVGHSRHDCAPAGGSKATIPHYRVEIEVDVGNLQVRRKQLLGEE